MSLFGELKRRNKHVGTELKMGKTKKLDESTAEDGTDDKATYQEKIRFLSAISQPLASRKLTKKLYKVIKKGKD